MRRLYPDVSQMIKEHSQSEVDKKALEQVISSFSAIPQAQASSEFQQRLRVNLLEQAHREKPGRVITFLRKIKPRYLSFAAVATIFLAITAVAGPNYFNPGKVGELANSQSSLAKEESTPLERPEAANKKLISPEENPAIQKASDLDVTFQDTFDSASKADLSQQSDNMAKETVKPLAEQAPLIAAQSFQAKGLGRPRQEEQLQGRFVAPRMSVSAESKPALEINYELKTPFPEAPKELGVYQPSSVPFSIEEIADLAAKFRVPSLPLVDQGEGYRVGAEQAYLEVSKSAGSFSYHNFNSEEFQVKISEAEARALTSKFINEKGLTLPAYDVEVLDYPERQLYQLRYIPLILGIQSPGQDISIEISYSGSVRTLSYQRYTLGTANQYPIFSPAEAWEQLKIEPIVESAPNTVIFVNSFKLVYHEFVQPDQKANQSFLQPAYLFSGQDNWGKSFERFLPAVKSEYLQQD